MNTWQGNVVGVDPLPAVTSPSHWRRVPKLPAARLGALAVAGFFTATGPSAATAATATNWPAVVGKAMNWVRARTLVPLEAPETLPAAGPVPNSATAYAGRYYAVALYGCPSPLPLNSPRVGVGSCGTMAQYYGYFQGNAYASPAAAIAALPRASPTCPDKSEVALRPGVVATLYYGPLPQGRCEAVWREGRWTFELNGDLNGGTRGDRTEPWQRVATTLASYLGSHLLPGAQGYFGCDIAGDGLHAGLYWEEGRDVYIASTYHGALAAAMFAIAMARYPR